MKASELRKVSSKAVRKGRRKAILRDYASIKNQIKNKAKLGMFVFRKDGRFSTAGEAARLLYAKSDGIRVAIRMQETYSGEWFCSLIVVSWGEGVVPECVVHYKYNDDDEL